MSADAPPRERPASLEEAAALLHELGQASRPVRVRGGATKLAWSAGPDRAATELHTGGLKRILEHNPGDFTAVLEAGVRLADAQAELAGAGQMVALDPPLGAQAGEEEATIGGVLASADSGPLRHRYGGVRDLVLGVTVALSDGTVARAGGKVIKNVAGYDLGKLFTGSLGTIGLVGVVALRLHPLADPSVTVRAQSEDGAVLGAVAARLAALPLEAECLDVGWAEGQGEVLVRFAGATAERRARAAVSSLRGLGVADASVLEDDRALWARQRAGQRCPGGGVVKCAGVIGDLPEVLAAASAVGGAVVSRAGLGLSWVSLPGEAELPARLGALRRRLPGLALTVLDGAGAVPDARPLPAPAAAEVMRRIKARFDPARIFPAAEWS